MAIRVTQGHAGILQGGDAADRIMATQGHVGALQGGAASNSVNVTQGHIGVLTESLFPVARIVCYTNNSVSQNTPTSTLYAWLRATFGTNVTMRESDPAGWTDLDEFDLFVMVTKESDDTWNARDLAETAGIPWVSLAWDSYVTFEGEGKTVDLTDASITGTWEWVDSSPGVTQINIVDTDHPITSGFSAGLLTVFSSAVASAAVDDGESVAGDVLAEADSSHANYVAGQAQIIAIETGTDDLQGSPVATTQRGLGLGIWDFSKFTADGNVLLTAAFEWVLGEKPLRPSIISATPDITSVTLTSSAFEHVGADRVHSASRWQVTTAADTTFASVVWDSNYTTDFTSITSPAVFDYDTSYIARVLHRDDLGQDSEWSASYAFDTDDLVAAGGAVVEFYTSGNSLISSVNTTIEDTDWVDVTLEDIEIPANTAYIRVSPYKDGSGLKKGYTRRMQVDLGSVPSAYTPFAFRPEVHRDHVIEARLATSAAATTVDVDWSLGRVHQKTLDQAATALTFSNIAPGLYVLVLIQDGTGGRTVTWPTAVNWAGGTAPTLSTGTNAVDVFGLEVVSSSEIYGFTIALNAS